MPLGCRPSHLGALCWKWQLHLPMILKVIVFLNLLFPYSPFWICVQKGQKAPPFAFLLWVELSTGHCWIWSSHSKPPHKTCVTGGGSACLYGKQESWGRSTFTSCNPSSCPSKDPSGALWLLVQLGLWLAGWVTTRGGQNVAYCTSVSSSKSWKINFPILTAIAKPHLLEHSSLMMDEHDTEQETGL